MPSLHPTFTFYRPSRLYYVKSLNLNLDSHINNNITHLIFTNSFNSPLTSPALSPSLTHLIFGTSFNQEVDHLLPPTLKYLKLSHAFSYTIDHLPASLTHLIIGRLFNKCIDHLPPLLTHLIMDSYCSFNYPIPSLPPSLEVLQFGARFNQEVHFLQQLPNSSLEVPFQFLSPSSLAS